MFPLIKKRVPHANLHIFYDFGGVERFAAFSESEPISHHRELGYRSRYIKEAIRRLEGLDVFVHQSVSRERMQDEMATAEILAYPCDPVHYTETFGVTVLEACAAGAIPVLCTADAFGELWGNITPNVPPPFANSKRVFLDLVCKVLSSDEIRESYVNKCSEYAKLFQWNILSNALELNLYSRGDNGLAHVDWLL
jgi:glycosyltransferase involved in cell wall biosynthesis